jgi:hypothetical protein
MTPRAVALVVVCLVLVVGCGQSSNPPASALVSSSTRPAAPKTWTREEFRKLVMGKTPDEVIAAVGRPDKIHDDQGGQSWYYDQRTIETLNDTIDNRVRLRIEGGRVVDVSY